ncbi:M20 family metallopeptidase [Actomonas aquatica]|uniref:M20/M25/M40 family metallo-hydrolase n=1 Tax=Actomonas aquatica TaxID=2866162 RepID=A0ABZ1C3M2_9BACT|nr:M20/M25/M40 family metallo-hydrolase [Opitutus sp. WL0086]WRQ86149.1 M20/M25/M40 family metallo-hydrolase [Opitutus sp. WL0086]
MSTPSLSSFLDQSADRLTTLLRELVQCDTTNPPGRNYDAMTHLLVDRLAETGLSARRLNVPKAKQREALPPAQWDYPRYNVLGKWKVPGAKRTLHFNAHYDVVPVSGKWRHGDPFGGQVDRGWIYGRGTADMKGSIASLLLALQALRAAGVKPNLNVEVSFTADEETDSVLGSEWLVRHAPISPDYAVVMEGGEGAEVCCGHNGVTWLEVVVHGKAAHGSQPEKGVNALEKMSALVLALGDYKQRLAERTFTAPDGTVMRPTMNLGGEFAQGPGGKINTVPSEGRFTIDRRVLAIETAAGAEKELRAELKRAAASIPGCRITINKISENHPCFSAPEGPFFATMAECVQTVRRAPTTFSVSSGFNDMHFFSAECGIPTLGYGPGGVDYHAIDERAKVKDLINCAKIYARLLTTFEG